MKHRHVLLFLVSTVVVSGALFANCCPRSPLAAPKPKRWTPADTDRVVAYATTDTCPAPLASPRGLWRHGRVFPPEPGVTMPLSMRRLCFYEWQPAGPGKPAEYDKLPLTALGPLSEDPVVVGSTADVALLTRVQSNFLDKQIEPPLTAPAPGSRVTLGVADASPTGDAIQPGASQHGFNVGWIALKTSCLGGTCASPSMELVLDHYALPGGGVGLGAAPGATDEDAYGSTSRLAQGIFELVNRWRRTNPSSHLVINLSVGWEPNGDGACDDPPAAPGASRIPAPLRRESSTDRALTGDLQSFDVGDVARTRPRQIVRDALSYAACSGALVIAAAGNQTASGQRAKAPTCPARWASPPVSPDVECKRFQGPTTDGSNRFGARPTRLVYIAGAVDYAGQPLVSTRDGGFPALAAPGYHGVAFPSDPPALPATGPSPYSRDLSGTSVSAAVVSGIAAAVWAQNPSFAADQVMSVLQGSAIGLDTLGGVARAATFCDSSPCGRASRASLCRALAFSSNGRVPDGACQFTHDEQVPTNDGGTVDASSYDAEDAGAFDSGAGPGGGTFAPWVGPQPEDPACPSCFVSLSGKDLYVYIETSYPAADQPLTSMTLRYYDANANLIVGVPSLPPASLRAGVYVIDTNLRIPGPPDQAQPVTATLQWTLPTGARTSEVQITILR